METLTITIFHLLWVYVKQKFAETKIETISLASSAAASMLQRPRPIIEANVVTVLDSGKVSIFCRFLLGVRKPNHVINESDVQPALSTNGWHPVMTQWGALMPSHWRTPSLQRCVTRDGIPTKWFLIVGLNLWYITLKEFHCSSMFKGKIENILEAALFFFASSDHPRFSNQSDPGRLEQWYGNPATQKMQGVHLQWKTPTHSNRVRWLTWNLSSSLTCPSPWPSLASEKHLQQPPAECWGRKIHCVFLTFISFEST